MRPPKEPSTPLPTFVLSTYDTVQSCTENGDPDADHLINAFIAINRDAGPGGTPRRLGVAFNACQDDWEIMNNDEDRPLWEDLCELHTHAAMVALVDAALSSIERCRCYE
jgi:hypothetical protein